jgi:hypothetical protein
MILMWMCWLSATAVLALTPLLVFATGASDEATESDQVAVGVLGVLIAYPLLIAVAQLSAPRRVRSGRSTAIARGTTLAVYAAVSFALAWQAAGAATFRGNALWVAYWLLCTAGWLALAWKLVAPNRAVSSGG